MNHETTVLGNIFLIYRFFGAPSSTQIKPRAQKVPAMTSLASRTKEECRQELEEEGLQLGGLCLFGVFLGAG